MQPAAKAGHALRWIVRDPKKPIGVCTTITPGNPGGDVMILDHNQVILVLVRFGAV